MSVLRIDRLARRAGVAKPPHRPWRYACVALSLFWVASCAYFKPGPPREEEVRSKLACVEIGEGTPWQELTAVWGEPEHLLPPPTVNLDKGPFVRRYDGRTLLVTAGTRKVEDANGKRFEEVILKVEACKDR